ncbi:MAG: CopG family transcriptional regulator [Spirochaetes bacterium GWD1_27_9]|nr:MAG: CopG family transcriptional regulator [Spirochaetes bacterium GWB1_27_13]OHD20837.1 MAG: CopG family transcriptional regulator [Spirochaetes bacterium GWC1_27_15]OHD30617.1 MAG: CopG family transcriptional regulator [Spirochaetes bacterium GWD1_27_9]
MEKRVGVIALIIQDRQSIQEVNSIFSAYNEIIIGRQGIPLRDKGIHIISLIVEGTTDEIGALTGKIGKVNGVLVKSVLTKFKENEYESIDKTRI